MPFNFYGVKLRNETGAGSQGTNIGQEFALLFKFALILLLYLCLDNCLAAIVLLRDVGLKLKMYLNYIPILRTYIILTNVFLIFSGK